MFFRRFFLVMDRVVWWWIELYDDESSYNRVLWWIELYDDEIEMSMCDSGMIWFNLDMWWWIGDKLSCMVRNLWSVFLVLDLNLSFKSMRDVRWRMRWGWGAEVQFFCFVKKPLV
jgi:hypothetical protein